MINWRKPMINAAFRLKGQPVFRYLKFLKSIERKSREELIELQNDKLCRLLSHAYKNVPYYNKVLARAGVARGETLDLDSFHQIPVLTKEIIRREGKNLYSKDHKQRGWYFNTSGGSTGEPVKFIQDKDYEAWNYAARFLYNSWGAKEVGEPELQLWGSERDVLAGKEKLSVRLWQRIFNKSVLNAYRLSQEDMRQHVKRWNHMKPKQVWAYTDSMYKFSKFVERQKLTVYSPGSIICTTANLLPEAREHIERTFKCEVFNQYGGREVGTIACECGLHDGMHIFVLHQKLEILDSRQKPVESEGIGEIVVTNLNNYSMPLIRYRIGDTGCFLNRQCPCGRGSPLLKEV
ncbi:MAG: phenylacetate--CoA ligase family protein, partial [Planctomycetota bacterium]